MITTKGAVWIKRHMANQVPNIAESIAYGVGSGSETLGESLLNFEVGRSSIRITSYDYTNDALIFKTSLPLDDECVIHEIGLFSKPTDDVAGASDSKLLTTFDSARESWKNLSTDDASTYTTDNTETRVGASALAQSPAASGNVTDYLNVNLDLASHASVDYFSFIYFVGSAYLDHALVRLMTDTSNYFQATITSGAESTAGFHLTSMEKGSLAVTGSPSWSSINRIEVQAFAGSGGAADVRWDGIRIENANTINPDFVMIGRQVLTIPIVKVAGKAQDVEFAISVDVS